MLYVFRILALLCLLGVPLKERGGLGPIKKSKQTNSFADIIIVSFANETPGLWASAVLFFGINALCYSH